MPDLLYNVSGQTGNLDIQPYTPRTRAVSGKADEIAFDTQLMEQYNREINAAMEEYRVRAKDIRPYMGETEQGLYQSIVQPVLNKWEMVPGFGSAGSSRASMMNAERQATEAARRATAFQSFNARVPQLKQQVNPATGRPFTHEEATVRATIENPELLFGGSGAGSVLQTFGRPQAPTFDPTKLQVSPIPGSDRQVVSGPGMRPTVVPTPPPGRVSQAVKMKAAPIQKQIDALEKEQDAVAGFLPEGTPKTDAQKNLLKTFNAREQQIKTLKKQLEDIMGGSEPSDEEGAATAQPTGATKRFVWTPQGLKAK